MLISQVKTASLSLSEWELVLVVSRFLLAQLSKVLQRLSVKVIKVRSQLVEVRRKAHVRGKLVRENAEPHLTVQLVIVEIRALHSIRTVLLQRATVLWHKPISAKECCVRWRLLRE